MNEITRAMTPFDILIGRNIRRIRTSKGISLDELGKATDITLQQIQKYETGVNRCSSGRLWKIARALGAPVGLFFQGLDGDDSSIVSWPPDRERTVLEFVKLYYQLPLDKCETVRQVMRSMMPEGS